ncbi:MAG: hypothetical protein IT160_15545 [Bryobacterales bacterium]|nr:hypothetical protein [Bryobacterales bacterium]
MNNFDSLKTEIQQYLEQSGFAVFHSYSRALPDLTAIEWDTKRYPDYRLFLQAAQQLDARLIAFHHREFSGAAVDEVSERLEMAEMAREEKRVIARRLEEMSAYQGFTCVIELSFDAQGRTYLFDLRTPWYKELEQISDDVDDLLPDDDEEDEEPMGGYFSRN